jgi:hypothetical protein
VVVKVLHNFLMKKVYWVRTVDGAVFPYIDNGLFLDGRRKTLEENGLRSKFTSR